MSAIKNFMYTQCWWLCDWYLGRRMHFPAWKLPTSRQHWNNEPTTVNNVIVSIIYGIIKKIDVGGGREAKWMCRRRVDKYYDESNLHAYSSLFTDNVIRNDNSLGKFVYHMKSLWSTLAVTATAAQCENSLQKLAIAPFMHFVHSSRRNVEKKNTSVGWIKAWCYFKNDNKNTNANKTRNNSKLWKIKGEQKR